MTKNSAPSICRTASSLFRLLPQAVLEYQPAIRHDNLHLKSLLRYYCVILEDSVSALEKKVGVSSKLTLKPVDDKENVG
jgi:hypothetical protein